MKRREFITLLGGAVAAWPLAARAQQPTKVARIGFVGPTAADSLPERVEAFRAGLRELGYQEGRDIVIEFRWADGVDQLPQLAAELVQMEVDVIFAPTSTYVEAAQRATKTIPIVFANHADPVGIGHVASLGHPGGNSTGLTMLLTDLSAKELQMLKEVVPQATRIGVLWNPTTPSHPPAVHAVEAAGEKLRIALHIVPVRTVDDFDPAFETMTRERVGGFLDIVSPLTFSHRAALTALALKHRLPGAFGFREFVDMGGLMSYGPDVNDLHRRAAVYIDKILKGIKPANLPVEQASKYQLVINLKTARALGLEVPPMLLALADEVIE